MYAQQSMESYLEQYDEVERDLQAAADPELRRRLAQHEVRRLEHVAARPHHHHAQAATEGQTHERFSLRFKIRLTIRILQQGNSNV